MYNIVHLENYVVIGVSTISMLCVGIDENGNGCVRISDNIDITVVAVDLSGKIYDPETKTFNAPPEI